MIAMDADNRGSGQGECSQFFVSKKEEREVARVCGDDDIYSVV